MSRPSLARRLLVTSVAALLLALGAGGTALSYAFRRSAEAAFDVRLRAWSDALVASLGVDAHGNLVLERDLGDRRFTQAFSGWYWSAGASEGPALASRSLWDAELRLEDGLEAEGARPEPHALRAAGPRGQTLRALVRTLTLPGRVEPVRVVLAGEDAELRRETERFDVLLFASLTTLAVALVALLGTQMQLALRPIRVLAADLAAVRDGRRSRVATEVPRELEPLADAVNALLAHDADLVERARTQTADLAHALKTPLSLVLAEAGELADERGRRIARHAETMRRHIERRLRGAAPRAAVAGERTPLRPVLEGIAATFRRLHPEREIEVDADDAIVFPGPREDLEEIAGNLLENACKWARRRVRVRARGCAPGIEIAVEDDGRGLAPHEREEVLARGARLDERAPGWGLGLGIVSDVVAAHGGRLTLENGALGGLRARVSFPA